MKKRFRATVALALWSGTELNAKTQRRQGAEWWPSEKTFASLPLCTFALKSAWLKSAVAGATPNTATGISRSLFQTCRRRREDPQIEHPQSAIANPNLKRVSSPRLRQNGRWPSPAAAISRRLRPSPIRGRTVLSRCCARLAVCEELAKGSLSWTKGVKCV